MVARSGITMRTSAGAFSSRACGGGDGERVHPRIKTRDKSFAATPRRTCLRFARNVNMIPNGARRNEELETRSPMLHLAVEMWTFGIVGVQRCRVDAGAALDGREHGRQHE